MNWQPLFHMQQELDNYIVAQHQLENEQVFDKKILALLVEVGELANETRCFKYWSLKPASPNDVIAEEYVDGIHFILSLGLELGLDDFKSQDRTTEKDLSSLFNDVFEKITTLKNERTIEAYKELFQTYLLLGNAIGFSADDMKDAYLDKNKVNYDRQNHGY
ncbi:dUTP diphosphatase [Gracilibacillus sp. YIM 98692]|uniref:dUTP diphosphatase n=1 Tax=Gracilibacillus sp. YIM 98692 TaxID=2663532 RepID=UPI0013CF83C4|nr:dUTP diphosphatase [Gracilibacillus sp. YIM 98692]